MHTVVTLGTLADNYMYVVEADGLAVVVDPGEASPALRALERSGSRLLAVLCTHGHFDHKGGSEDLAQRFGCPIMVPGEMDGGEPVLTVGPFAFTILRTPGHSDDSVCLYLPPVDGKPGDVFTGDTLFIGGCGRLLTRSPETMWKSLRSLAALAADTRVYPGHDYTLENYEFAVTVEPGNARVRSRLEELRALIEEGRQVVPSTIGQERDTNPFLRAATPEMKQALGMEDASDLEAFAELRRRKDRF